MSTILAAVPRAPEPQHESDIRDRPWSGEFLDLLRRMIATEKKLHDIDADAERHWIELLTQEQPQPPADMPPPPEKHWGRNRSRVKWRCPKCNEVVLLVCKGLHTYWCNKKGSKTKRRAK